MSFLVLLVPYLLDMVDLMIANHVLDVLDLLQHVILHNRS